VQGATVSPGSKRLQGCIGNIVVCCAPHGRPLSVPHQLGWGFAAVSMRSWVEL
jgi:hypothetical protein